MSYSSTGFLTSSSGPLPIQQDYSQSAIGSIQAKKPSIAEEHIQPARLSFSDEPRKVYIGRIPKNTPDALIENLLRICCGNPAKGNGTLKVWKRSQDGAGNPKAFGIAEFDSLEVVFVVHRLLNNSPMTFEGSTSRLLVNLDEKTKQFLSGWSEIKKQEWLAK